MEDFAIPEEYYTCHADRLFDLLADSLLTFARRLGWCEPFRNPPAVVHAHSILPIPSLPTFSCLHASMSRAHALVLLLTAVLVSLCERALCARCAALAAALCSSGPHAVHAVCPPGSPLGARAPPVGFCFSFPVKQSGVAAGRVAALTKRFENEGLLDCDPVRMLQAAFKRMKAPVRCSRHLLGMHAQYPSACLPFYWPGCAAGHSLAWSPRSPVCQCCVSAWSICPLPGQRPAERIRGSFGRGLLSSKGGAA
jgi:hypothetical protein